MSPFTATYDRRARAVTLTHSLGLLHVASTIPLATYEARQQQWPGLYPETMRVAARLAEI